MITTILANTPVWVWGLLAALVALGLSQTRSRNVAPPRLLALPLALLGLGLWSMAPAFAAVPLAALGWVAALTLSATMARRLTLPAGARWLPTEGRLHLPGSWLPLAVIMVIFLLRYTLGVGQAFHPDWRTAQAVQLPLAAVYGAISGLLLGRALGLMRLRPAPARTMRSHEQTSAA
jgi:hypothetical protein